MTLLEELVKENKIPIALMKKDKPQFDLAIGFMLEKYYPGEVEMPLILDLGCGIGMFFERLFNVGFERYTGVDRNKKYIDVANRVFGYLPRCNFYCEDIHNVSLGSNQFDLVVAFDVLYFPTIRIHAVIREAARLLKKNGYFLFDFPTERGPAKEAQIWKVEGVSGLLTPFFKKLGFDPMTNKRRWMAVCQK